MLPELSLDLSEFSISRRNGFLPDVLPLAVLRHSYYQPWEVVISDLPALLKSHEIRSRIDDMPVLSMSHLATEAEWQRAYVILSFLAHAYIWGGDIPSQKLPAQVAIPYLAAADRFDLPAAATFASLGIWNYAPALHLTEAEGENGEIDLCQPENLRSLHTFTGTKSEEWFYIISVAMEARGGSIIVDILTALDAAHRGETEFVTESLATMAQTIKQLGALLARMYEHCDPYVFYYDIRPVLAGSKNMGHVGLPKGVFYDEGDGKGEWRAYSGGSNAQSSLIQFFDVVLGVEHKATGETDPKKKLAFLKEMRRFMPAPHTNFLNHLETLQSFRPFVLSHPFDHPITLAYNSAVEAFAGFRDIHMQIVTRYIIIPSKNPRRDPLQETSVNLATVSLVRTLSKEAKEGEKQSKEGGGLIVPLHGTGGTALVSFLKQTRNETLETARS